MQPRSPIETVNGAKVESCVNTETAEACKAAFVEQSPEGIEAGIKATATAFKKETAIEMDNGIGLGAKFEMGKAEADAEIKLNTQNTQVKLGAGAWLAKVTGGAKLKLGCADNRCYEFSIEGSAGIGAQVGLDLGAKKSSEKSTYNAGVGVGPIKGKFVLTITDKNTGLSKKTELPPEFSDLMQKQFNSFDSNALEKNANSWFLNFLKKYNKKYISEQSLQQFAKEETARFLKGEGEVHQQLIKHEKQISKDTNAAKIFNEASEVFQGIGAMLHLAGNRHATKFVTMGHIVSSIPQAATTVKQSFNVVSGLLSGKVALSMGSAMSILSGLGAIATIGSTIKSLFGGSDNDEIMEFLGRMDIKLDTILQNQVIMDKKLDVIDAKANKIFEVVNQIFFVQKLNHKELVELLIDNFSNVQTALSDTQSLLSRTHTLISEESAELRNMLKEDRFTAIQELDEVVSSKLKRKQTAFEHFLDEDFDELYTKAKIASTSSALTGSDKDCQSENRLTQLSNIRQLDYYSAFNVINFIDKCIASATKNPKMSNLIGTYILVDTLTKIVDRLIKENQPIREFLPEVDLQIQYIQTELHKIDQLTDDFSQQFAKTKQSLQAVQAQVNHDVNAFEEKVKQQNKDVFTPLLLDERKKLENETSWRTTDNYAYPKIWREPLRKGAGYDNIFRKYNPGPWIDVMKNLNWHQMSEGRIYCYPRDGVWCTNDHTIAIFGRVEKQEPNVITDFIANCKQFSSCDPCSATIQQYYYGPLQLLPGGYYHPIPPKKYFPQEVNFHTKLSIKHDAKLFEEVKLLSRQDLVGEQKQHFAQLHQDHLKSWDQAHTEQSKTLSLEVDGHVSELNDKPILRHMFPENNKGPALPIPDWVDWQKLFPKELYAELLKIGYLSFTYGVKDNIFIFDVHFVYQNNQTKSHLYRFTDNLEKYICEPVIYHDLDKASYYWEGGTYCYKPSVEKLFISAKNILFQAFDYPAHTEQPGNNKATMPESATFNKTSEYEHHETVLQTAIDTRLTEWRSNLKHEINDNLLKKLPLAKAIEDFEFNLRLLHQGLMLKASDSATAELIHDKLSAIAERCDREGILAFNQQYEGGRDYLEHHVQTCIDDLARFEKTLPTLSLKGNYLLTQTQAATNVLKDKVSPTKPDLITDEAPTNGAYTAASSSLLLNSIHIVRDFAKSSLSATFASAKLLGSTAAHYAGKLFGSTNDTSSEKAKSNSFSSSPRGINLPGEAFRVKPSQPDPSEARPASFDENLMLAICAMNKLKHFLPWYKEAELTESDKILLQEQQQILQGYAAQFPNTQFERALKLEILTNEFAHLENIKSRMIATQNLISDTLKSNKISSSDKSSIANNLHLLDDSMKTIHKLSHQLRQDVRHEQLQDRRQLRKQGKLATASNRGFFSEPRLSGSVYSIERPCTLPNGHSSGRISYQH